jgi:hemin uptake protein HemP
MPDSSPDERPRSKQPSKDQTAAASPPEVAFDDLAHGSKEVLIEHRGQVYRLRATRNGGLILNK